MGGGGSGLLQWFDDKPVAINAVTDAPRDPLALALAFHYAETISCL
ncbi:hypothetical protein [Acetobacter pasteurianus]|nr:hypothetical protein [Acetobacter pasteurianus]